MDEQSQFREDNFQKAMGSLMDGLGEDPAMAGAGGGGGKGKKGKTNKGKAGKSGACSAYATTTVANTSQKRAISTRL